MAKGDNTNRVTWLVAVGDAVLIAIAYGIALIMRFDFSLATVPYEYMAGYSTCILPLIISAMAFLWGNGLYRSIWSFVSMSEIIRLSKAWLCEGVLIAVGATLFAPPMPKTFWVAGTLAAFALTTVLRYSWRIVNAIQNTFESTSGPSDKRVMVIGAGKAGRELLRETATNTSLGLRVVCAIDDSEAKQGRLIEGVPIVGGSKDIPRAARETGATIAFVAMPSASGGERRDIITICQDAGLEVRVVPGIYQFLDGQLSVHALRNVNLEDLLGRDPVEVDSPRIHGLIRDKCVLVTGGGGSIGSELCRQVAKEGPSRLVIFDIYENNAYAIQQELMTDYPSLNLSVIIGSVRDGERVDSVFATFCPDIVFHAAAHKHVPLMEDSPCEAVKNNVAGTQNVARAAAEHDVMRMVLISTDKAVNPTNVMGASKRLCEMVVQAEERSARAAGLRTTFSAVRFGNVLGSNGSVVPLFEHQIAQGGPVTVTDRRVTRYFMTIPEAVSLVLQAACYAEGGEVFVLDMGEPVKIDDMARNLIRLAGFEPDTDIEIRYTGLRPGEKLYEERLMDQEGLGNTPNRMISVARPIEMDDRWLRRSLAVLYEAAEINDEDAVRTIVEAIVPTYHPERGGAHAQERVAE